MPASRATSQPAPSPPPRHSTQDQGNAAFKAGRFEEAAEHFSAAIALDPSNHVLYSNRSAAHASLKRYDAALADAKKTVELKGDWAKVGGGCGGAACSLRHAACGRRHEMPAGGQLARACGMQQQCSNGATLRILHACAAVLSPHPLQGYSRLGAAHHGLRQWSEAAAAYSKGNHTCWLPGRQRRRMKRPKLRNARAIVAERQRSATVHSALLATCPPPQAWSLIPPTHS